MRPRLAVLRAIPIRGIPCRKSYSTAPRISLAYDLHEPSKPSNAPRAIIFMHGLFGSKKNNRGISKALARDLGRPVYAVDLRNHGDSPHNPNHDYMAMADDVAGFIEEHQLKNTTLIGHSMGAKTAMTLALKAPDMIDNIVSVDNAPLDAALLSNFGKYIQGMKKIEEAGVTRQAEADKILQEYEEASTPISRGLSLPIRQFLLGNLYRPPGEKIQKFKVPLRILGSALDNLGDFPFKDPGAVRFEKPALFVRGTQSKYVPDEALPIIGQFFPRFVLADIDAGHWVISEKPEEFRQAVVEFLSPKE
ncbi:Abhydrolase domain-containing protein [Lachnellula hyalina]|uniref:Abhydrolase domain-containing protein n=1 Tax=Lachnellula hyalina TaxID=1316788 RepID=A0A8H8QZ04_9HELO|nr:Abhydrolase domain-containing protein [Lachnellula hyalina]TVY25383.1 Abhydrolase domain-containing protein [Lachnellula hyalina]